MHPPPTATTNRHISLPSNTPSTPGMQECSGRDLRRTQKKRGGSCWQKSRPLCFDQPLTDGLAQGFRAPEDIELLIDVGEMKVHRAFADIEACGNLFIAQATHQQLQHL